MCFALLIVLGFLLGIFAICIPVQLVCAIMIVVSARARLAILVVTRGAIPSILAAIAVMYI